MTEHPNEVIADDNVGTLRAIESTRQLKAPLRNRRRVGSTGWTPSGSRLLPLAFGMLDVPLPARLLTPIIAARAFSRHARRVYRTATPPKITAVKPHSQKVHECVT